MCINLTCDHCAACCVEQGSPPGYLWVFDLDTAGRSQFVGPEDCDRLGKLSAGAVADLAKHQLAVVTGQAPLDGLCVWLDPDTLRCRWYEHRPQVCRDHQVGGESCLNWRKRYGIGEV